MALAYRRQLDRNPASASLRVLLEELKCRPSAYCVESLRAYMGVASDRTIYEDVVRTVASDDSDCLDTAIVNSDMASLIEAGENIRNFVNKHIAHTDIAASTEPFTTTFDEIHEAAITCERIAARWVTALTGAAYRFDVVTQYARITSLTFRGVVCVHPKTRVRDDSS